MKMPAAPEVPKSITIDLSALAPKDREIVHAQLVRAQKFANAIPVIRAVNPDVADKLLTSYNSKQSSVFAESEVIEQKVSKGRITLLTVSPNSTDAFYIQDKIGGIYTRLEIKSIIQVEASTVDKEITNAEVQHRDRLNDEQGKPTWHKTTIVIGNPDNPWPFSHMSELKSARADRIRLLTEAETRIDRLFLGSMQPGKSIKREPAPLIKERLKDAEERAKKSELNPLTPIKRDSSVSIPMSPQLTSLKSKVPKQPSQSVAASDKQTLSVVQKSEAPSLDSKSGKVSAVEKKGLTVELRKRRPEQVAKKEEPMSPLALLLKGREEARAKVVEKVSELDQDVRVERKMLVTEQVTVICPHLDLTFVLDRQANKFTAHFKNDPKSLDQVKRERKHWGAATALIREWRKSADPDGNNPLHLAIIKGDMGLVKFFSREAMMNSPNNNGDLPVHLAAKAKNPGILRLLIDQGCGVNATDGRKNTPLHFACSARNVENVRILIESGGDLDKINSSKQTPRSIIEGSKNPLLKECLAINVKPKV